MKMKKEKEKKKNQNLTNIYQCNDAKLNTKLKIHYKLIIKWEGKKSKSPMLFNSMKILLLVSPLPANENANQDALGERTDFRVWPPSQTTVHCASVSRTALVADATTSLGQTHALRH